MAVVLKETTNHEGTMGLTVHYSITSTARNRKRVRQQVEQMRQICMDLPFNKVCDITELVGDATNFSNYGQDDDLRWSLVQACQSIAVPWSKNLGRSRWKKDDKTERNGIGEASISVSPSHVISCNIWGLDGSEPMNIGLCQFPQEIELDYRPEDDAKFRSFDKSWHGHCGFGFDARKWRRYAAKQGWAFGTPEHHYDHEMHHVKRKVKTGFGKRWYWNSFCKTQYASDPAYGGVPNFLRAHIGIITALERFNELPALKVEIDDEGDYGRNWTCPDWQDADAEGRKRVYKWLEGHHDPNKLAKEVGGWNRMMAAAVGAMNDAAGEADISAPITNFSNFETLEHFGRLENGNIDTFLQQLKPLVKPEEEE